MRHVAGTGDVPAQPRPAGTLLECGRFGAADSEVWAYDWYGHGRRCLVARCVDADGAVELAGLQNVVLRS